MAEKRMFTKRVTNSDEFLSMPNSTQNLYFHLNMEADDEGFVNSPKRIMRTILSSEDDLNLLLMKRFVIGFKSGVIVIKHWKMHNTLRKDRFKPTDYHEEKALLIEKDNGVYTECQPSVNQVSTNGMHSIDKCSVVEVSIDKVSKELVENKTLDITVIKEIIDYLNKICERSYRSSTGKTKQLIKSRINEGFTIDDFKKVIDIKNEQWGDDNKMKEYLRPETLFGTKFESYLQQPKSTNKQDVPDYMETKKKGFGDYEEVN